VKRVTIRFGPQIEAAAAAHHLDPRLLAAVAAQETGGPGSDSGNNIVGDGGHGHGVFQIDDRYWAFARTPAAMNPGANADVAAGILGDDLRRTKGDVRAALSSYNAGSPTATGSLTRWGDGKVLGYADSVLRHYDLLGGSFEQLAADVRATMHGAGALHAAAHAQPAAARPSTLTCGTSTLPGPPLALAATSVVGTPAGLGMTAGGIPPAPPLQTWTQMTASSTTDTAAADRAVADLIDSGDVFASDDDSVTDA